MQSSQVLVAIIASSDSSTYAGQVRELASRILQGSILASTTMAWPSYATAPPLPLPPPPPLPPPVAVVDPRYCVDYPVDMTIAQKALSLTHGDYSIVDINGNVLFKVKGKVLSISRQRALIDTAGNTFLTMKGKIMSMHNTWQIFRGVSTDQKDLLFSVKKSKFIQFKTELNVYLAANTSETVPDFQVKGNWYVRPCTIYLGESTSNVILAQMREQYTFMNVFVGRDMFGVTVYPKVDYAFIVALIIILDEIKINPTADGWDIVS